MRLAPSRTPLALLTLLALLILTACSSGGGSVKLTPVASSTPNSANATQTVTASPTDAPTLTPLPGGGAQQGSNQFCSQPPSVSTQLPADVPSYPAAQLRLAQPGNGSAIFGLCSTDTVSAIITFYQQQLPTKGWGGLVRNSNPPNEQVLATHGSNTVTITVYPDSELANTTDIIIQTMES